MRRRVPILAAIATLGYVVGATYHWWYWDFDDGLIVYRIVEHLVSGAGWSYNAGESHNTSTSVLSPLLIAMIRRVGGDTPAAAHLLGGVWIGGTALVFMLLCREKFGDGVGVLAGLGIARYLAYNETWGLETHLYLFLLSLYVLLHLRGRNPWGLIGLLTLTRPDAALLAGLEWFRAFRRTRQLPVLGPVLFLVVLAPWVIYSLLTFHQVFPDTLSNKIWQGNSGYWGTGHVYLKAIVGHLVAPEEPVYILVYVLSVPGMLIWLRERSALLQLLAFVLLQQLVYILLNVPGYHWYFAALDGTLMAAAWCAIGHAYRFLTRSSGRAQRQAIEYGTTISALVLSAVLAFRAISIQVRDARSDSYKGIAREIVARDLPAGHLATLEVGTLGFCMEDRPIVDMVGLVSDNPEFVSGKNNDSFFTRPPAIVLLHSPLWDFEQALYGDLRFQILYGKAHQLPDPDYPMQYFLLNRARENLQDFEIDAYIKRHYQSFTVVTDPRLLQPVSGRPEVRCSLDRVNGQLVNGGEISVPPWVLSVSGWAVDGARDGIEDRIFVLLTSRHRRYSLQAERTHRPDIAEHLGRPEYEQAGFTAQGSILDLRAGDYRIGIAQESGTDYLYHEFDNHLVIDDRAFGGSASSASSRVRPRRPDRR